jgi:hypothetical protein
MFSVGNFLIQQRNEGWATLNHCAHTVQGGLFISTIFLGIPLLTLLKVGFHAADPLGFHCVVVLWGV